MCTQCATWDGTETKAIGVTYSVYGVAITSLGEIHVTPVCEDHANSNVIRFVKEDENFCEHGVYVGGIGRDRICSACEAM